MAKAKVLIVDDEPINFCVLEGMIPQENYLLSFASSGEEALELVRTLEPDAILMDVMMPGMSGIEACQRLKSDRKYHHIPIIMVTALSSKDDLSYCLSSGADDFISKPVHRQELRARLQSMIRLKQQYDALSAAMQLREDMTRAIVHDLRSPLTNILFTNAVLARSELNHEQQLKVQRIGDSCTRLQHLIDDILTMSRLDAGKLILNRTLFDLSALVRASIEELIPLANAKDITLHNYCHGGCQAWVDVSLFRRIIDNLLSNAIKFSPIHTSIEISNSCFGATWIFDVKDSGMGITRELKEMIFNRYEVGEAIPGINQIGLGLAFCKLVAEAHGGKISVTDNIPQGACFRIEVPIAIA